MQKIISPVQTVFIKGRFIVEGVLILHEALNNIHVKKQNVVLFKVEFEKSYKKFKCPFVGKMLQLKGFLDIWIE